MGLLEFLLGIGGNLLSAAVGFGIGWLWRSTQRTLRTRRARRFWRPFLSGEPRIVIGRFLEFAAFEPTGLVGAGSANALAELRTYLSDLGRQDIAVSYADEIGRDQLRSNLILLGGPDSNRVTREALESIKPSFQFGDPSIHEVAIYDSATGTPYMASTATSEHRVTSDVGLIVRSVNPFDSRTQVLILAGSFGYGTWASARFMTSPEFLRNQQASSGNPVEVMISAAVFAGSPQSITLVDVRALIGR